MLNGKSGEAEWDESLLLNTEKQMENPFESGKQSAKVVMVEPEDSKMNNRIQRICTQN